MINRKTKALQWSVLAIASAIFITPAAFAGGKAFSSAVKPMPAAAQQQQVLSEQYSRYIISYRHGVGSAKRVSATAQRKQFDAIGKAMGMSIVPMRTLATGASLVKLTKPLDRAGSKRLINELMKDPSIIAVEPDRKLRALAVPSDPMFPMQWHYMDGKGGINAVPAWDLSTGEGVVVAVIDTGITPHAEFVGQTVPGYDFISADADGTFVTAVDGDGRDADPNDPGDWDAGECDPFGTPSNSSWHGTHVSGTVAAATNNAVGVAGVAYGAKVQPVRALGRCGGYTSDISDAVVWASGGHVDGVPDNQTPAEVINLSLGGSGACSVAEQAAYSMAISRGTTVVVAAGNSAGDVENFTPASCDGVIAVSAVGPDGALASYSNFGSRVAVAAPGGSGAAPSEDNVLSTLNTGLKEQGEDGYAWYAGTSMASPHVAGTVALMQSVAAAPMTPARVKKILQNTAYASGDFAGGCDAGKPCGAGIIDARAAVAVANGSTPLPPDPPPPPPPPPAIALVNGATVSGIEVGLRGDVFYEIEVPNASMHLLIALSGGTGDVDLTVRHGARPTDSTFDCGSSAFGNEEDCYFNAPAGGIWYVRVKGYEASSGVSLYASFVDSGYPYSLEAVTRRARTLITWKGGDPQVDVYKNDKLWKTLANLGSTLDSRFTGSIVPKYKICNAGTEECSDPELRTATSPF